MPQLKGIASEVAAIFANDNHQHPLAAADEDDHLGFPSISPLSVPVTRVFFRLVRLEGGPSAAVASEGLPQSVSRALPTVTFSDATFPVDHDPACVICLADFESKEVLRQLPQCHHAFHVNCIDQWFDKHSTCPVCRVSLLPTPLAPLPPEPPFPPLPPPPVPPPAHWPSHPPPVPSSTPGSSSLDPSTLPPTSTPSTLEQSDCPEQTRSVAPSASVPGRAALNYIRSSFTRGRSGGEQREGLEGTASPSEGAARLDGSSVVLPVGPEGAPAALGTSGQTSAANLPGGTSLVIDVR